MKLCINSRAEKVLLKVLLGVIQLSFDAVDGKKSPGNHRLDVFQTYKLTVDFNYLPTSTGGFSPSTVAPSLEQLDVLRERRRPTKIRHVCSQEHMESRNLWGRGEKSKANEAEYPAGRWVQLKMSM